MTTWFTWYIGSQHHAPTLPRPASRRRRQHTGPPHIIVVSTPTTAPTRIYTSFVFICMYIYVAEHCRPRSPMRFYVYGGAPPPSFTHVYKHIYGGVEHRHSCHTALSHALVWRIASVTEGQDLIRHIVRRFYACKQRFDVLYIDFVF